MNDGQELQPARALLLASVAEQRRGDMEGALQLANRALAVDPRCFEAFVHRGVLLTALRRPAEALASYEAALALRPDSVDVLYNRGTVLQSLERHADALACYENALAIRPDDVEALNNLGVCLLETGRPEEALAAFERALTLRPAYAEALNNRGNALASVERHAEALASYGGALALRPDHPETLNNRGNALRALARNVEALASFDRALAIRPSYPEALSNRSGALLALGKLADALASCDRALALRPNTVEALHNRGKVLAALGRDDEALECYGQALALRPDDARLLDSRGRALDGLGRHEEALASYNAALETGVGDAEIRWHRDVSARRLALPQSVQQALAAWSDGSPEEAEQLCRAFLESAPDHIDALLLLAALRHEREDTDEALGLLNRALEVDPRCHDALMHRASLLLGLRRPEQALASCEQMLRQRPHSSDALHLRGLALQALARHGEALASFDRALAIRPQFARALDGRGDALRALERDAEALESYRQALALRPDDRQALDGRGSAARRLLRDASSADAHCVHGHALEALGDYDEALASYRRALALRPQHTEALVNLGNVLCQIGRLDEAIEAYERVHALQPGNAEAHFNSSFAYLMKGDYAHGWPEYEWRREVPRVMLPQQGAEQPLWLGQHDVAGKTVLIYSEQGFGDTIQMVRYVPLLAARGAQVAIACHSLLEALMRTVDGVHTVFSAEEPPLAFDYHVPVMSLPRAFGTTLESIPSQVPYLRAAPAAVADWHRRLASLGERCRVGLVWAGNPRYRRDRVRSLPVDVLAPLLALPDCAFLSLQKGDAAASLARIDPRADVVMDHTAELESFADTAALIEALDLVITSDTAVAHLAGALAKPVWIMLASAPDWRWMRGREDSPWYPSARLFRQPRHGDWESVIEAVAAALATHVSQIQPRSLPAMR